VLGSKFCETRIEGNEMLEGYRNEKMHYLPKKGQHLYSEMRGRGTYAPYLHYMVPKMSLPPSGIYREYFGLLGIFECLSVLFSKVNLIWVKLWVYLFVLQHHCWISRSFLQ